MKKIPSVFLIFIFAFCIMLPAAQAAVKAEIPETNMTLDIPDQWIVFYKTVDAGDPNLALVKKDKATLEKLFSENNIYLNAVDPKTGSEIIVTMSENENTTQVFDFNLVNEKDITESAAKLKDDKKMRDKAVTLLDFAVYKHKQAKFIDFNRYYTQNGKKTYGKEYDTVFNGQAISLVYNAYGGNALTPEETKLVKDTVDSITFTKILKKPFNWTVNLTKGGLILLAVIAVVFTIKRRRKQAKELAKSRYTKE